MASTEQHTGVRFPWVRPAQAADSDTGTDPEEVAAPTFEPPAGEAGSNETADPATTQAAPDDPLPVGASKAQAAPHPIQAGATHKPSRFLGELVRAMLAAAQEARAAAIEQAHADAKSHVEAIHARSADQAEALKRSADEDNAGTRDWSKAEMARIREETERRIAERKEELAADLERHAARIEAEIDQVQQRVAAFEQEMERFFASLSEATDPTHLAMLAEQMPDPPQFDAKRSDADHAEAEHATDVEPTAASAPGPETSGGAEAAAETSGDTQRMAPEDGSSPVAEAAETDMTAGVAEPESAPEAVADTEGDTTETAPEEATAAPAGDQESQVTATAGDGSVVSSAADAEQQATLEAAAEVDTEGASGPDGGDMGDAPAARLAQLMSALPHAGEIRPAPDGQESGTPSVNSIVAVVGLVSVAGIASFKRHLARIPGVESVGVSSSPDGEFIFRVTHDPAVQLRDTVPALPGFAARIIKEADGRLSVSAHDPSNDA